MESDHVCLGKLQVSLASKAGPSCHKPDLDSSRDISFDQGFKCNIMYLNNNIMKRLLVSEALLGISCNDGRVKSQGQLARTKRNQDQQ